MFQQPMSVAEMSTSQRVSNWSIQSINAVDLG